MNEKFQNAIQRVPQPVPPIWFMRQAGRYHKHYQALRAKHTFIEMCKDPKLAAEVALGPVLDFDYDVSILFSDILFPLEAMGMGLKYDPAPELGWHLNSDTIKNLRPVGEALPELQFQKLAMAETRKVLPKNKSLIGFVGGPWTLFTYAVEGSHKGGLEGAKKKLALFKPFCDIILPLLIQNIRLQFEGGAEVVMLFDTAAGELSPRVYRDVVVPALEVLAKSYPAQLGYYAKGVQAAHLNHPLFKSGFAGLGFDHRWEMSQVLSEVNKKGFTQGNFDQSLLFMSENEFKEQALKYLEPIRKLSLEQRAGWVSGLGHGVLPGTPETNVRSLVQLIREVMAVSNLFEKYDVPAPRYTSYPTVPYWTDNPTTQQWIDELKATFARPDTTWSVYVHIPFCETLCTFCGCNTSITKDHRREEPYVELLHREWEHYLNAIPELRERPLLQFHLGGGTPTFLSPDNLKKLIEPMLAKVKRDAKHFEGSIEVDPRRTTREQLAMLRSLGFNRVSLGVQDFNPEVQRLVNRIQPREVTEKITHDARELGFESVNFDLIYGLPKQTPESVREMTEITARLRPDRIALYSFALVPWIKPAQRLFKDEDLPVGEAKRKLYEIAREILLKAGYREIGMDHFALERDSLSLADSGGTLHRNFMGYADRRTDVLLGLGVSAISEAPGIFHQNEKVLPLYERRVTANEIPTLRGHVLSASDRSHREQILKFMTKWQVDLGTEQIADIKTFLEPLFEDGLVSLEGHTLKLTAKGRPFLRNACMALDERLRAKMPDAKVFSSSV